jgi:hypothetical protein
VSRGQRAEDRRVFTTETQRTQSRGRQQNLDRIYRTNKIFLILLDPVIPV